MADVIVTKALNPNKRFSITATLMADENLSSTAKLVFAALQDHRNKRTAQCNPFESTLAAELGISKRTIVRRIAELEKAGMVIPKRTIRGNSYVFPKCHFGTSASDTMASRKCHIGTPLPNSSEPKYVNLIEAAASEVDGRRARETMPAAAAPKTEPPKPKPPARATSDPGVFAFVRASLNSLAEVTRMPVPDDDLVRRVIEAAPGASGEEIHEALKWLYQSDRLRNMRSWGFVLLKLGDLARKAETA